MSRYRMALLVLMLTFGITGCGEDVVPAPPDLVAAEAVPRNTKAVPRTTDGVPRNTKAVPRNTKAVPRINDGVTHTKGGKDAAARNRAEGGPAVTAPPLSLSFDQRTSPVEPVGVDHLNQLLIPQDIQTLGWWEDGAKPGHMRGFVVVTGHATVSGDGAANSWWSAEPGQSIWLRTTLGTEGYRVVSRKTYDKDVLPLARWFPSDGPKGPPRLALITCADYRSGEWQANTVVEAVPI